MIIPKLGILIYENYSRFFSIDCHGKIKCNDPNGVIKYNHNPCTQDTCERIVNNYLCRDPLPIEEGAYCGCKDGFYKNSDGECLTLEECEVELGKHVPVEDGEENEEEEQEQYEVEKEVF